MTKKYVLNEYLFHGLDFKSSKVLAIYSSMESAEQAKNEILEASYPNLQGDTVYIAIFPIETKHENPIQRSENTTKVYVLYAQEVEDRWVLGVFSSPEKVKEAWEKWHNERNPDTVQDGWWVDDEEYAIVECELDQAKVQE